MRQAVWDVTAYVQAAGPGTYTVADIMFERAGAYLPYASWTIVAAYELDPAVDIDADEPASSRPASPRGRSPGTTASSCSSEGAVDVPVDGFAGPRRRARCSPRRSTSPPTPSTAAPTASCSAVSRSATTLTPGNAPAPARRVRRRRPGLQQHDRHPQRLDLRARRAGRRRRRRAPPTTVASRRRRARRQLRLGRRLRRDPGARPLLRRRHDVGDAVAAASAGRGPVAVGDAGRVGRPARAGRPRESAP